MCLLLLLVIVAVDVRRGRHDEPLLIGSASCKGIHLYLSDQLLGLLVMLVLSQGLFHIGEDLRYQVHDSVGFLPGLVNARLEFLLSLS